MKLKIHYFFQLFGIVALFAILGAHAHADVTMCRPAANCGASDNPCYVTSGNSNVRNLSPNPIGTGAPVIRVRLCANDSDSMCESGSNNQSVIILGWSGGKNIFTRELELDPGFAGTQIFDTGPYTKLEGLTRLSVSCGITQPGDCHFIWQVCREEPDIESLLIGTSLKAPGAAGAKEGYSK